MKPMNRKIIASYALVAVGLLLSSQILPVLPDVTIATATWLDIGLLAIATCLILATFLGMALAMSQYEIWPVLLGTAGSGLLVLGHDGDIKRLLIVALICLVLMVPAIIRAILQGRKPIASR